MKYFATFALSALVAVVIAATATAAPTPVLLGNAAAFALLAGTGLTNTGVSTVNGDVGSSPNPAETGFAGCPAADCVALTGANHTDPNPNDAQTQSAKADLITAYNVAAGQTPTQVPTELAGTTLVAGVYNSAAGDFGMTGTLVLDGANNADSIFIFQMASTLTTGGTGNVSFIRGAQACNVFWQVGSSATLGAGSNFSGTLMALTNIAVGDGVTVNGRLLARNAAVTLIHDTVTKPSTCTTQASIDAAAAATAAASAAAAAAAQAAIDAKNAADRAAEAARVADAKAATEAAAKAAEAAAAAVKAAEVAAAAAEKAKADAAKAVVAKAAAKKAADSARVAKAAAKRARIAKATAIRLAIKLRRQAIRTPHTHAGFTG